MWDGQEGVEPVKDLGAQIEAFFGNGSAGGSIVK